MVFFGERKKKYRGGGCHHAVSATFFRNCSVYMYKIKINIRDKTEEDEKKKRKIKENEEEKKRKRQGKSEKEKEKIPNELARARQRRTFGASLNSIFVSIFL